MSGMESRVGTVSKIEIPDSIVDHFEKIVWLHANGYIPTSENTMDVEYEFDEFDHLAYFYAPRIEYIRGEFWLIDQYSDEYTDIGVATPTDNAGEYAFTCQWHNGGAGFCEILEKALEKAGALK